MKTLCVVIATVLLVGCKPEVKTVVIYVTNTPPATAASPYAERDRATVASVRAEIKRNNERLYQLDRMIGRAVNSITSADPKLMARDPVMRGGFNDLVANSQLMTDEANALSGTNWLAASRFEIHARLLGGSPPVPDQEVVQYSSSRQPELKVFIASPDPARSSLVLW